MVALTCQAARALPTSFRIEKESGMFQHILVPTDGSSRALHAARYAVRLAKLNGARITGFHVAPAYRGTHVEATTAASPSEYDEQVRREAERCLNELRGLAEAEGVRFEGRYEKSDFPGEAIVKAIDRYACDTVVIGSRRAEAGETGSVARQILFESRVPVLVT
jgi:nucleotide-binding universal stress UspA family protein